MDTTDVGIAERWRTMSISSLIFLVIKQAIEESYDGTVKILSQYYQRFVAEEECGKRPRHCSARSTHVSAI